MNTQCGMALTATVLALLVSIGRAQEVRIVDSDGGSPHAYTQIADALAASNSGDVIIVKPGTQPYLPFTVNVGQAVTIVGDPSLPRPIVRGLVRINFIGSGKCLVISNLIIVGNHEVSPVPALATLASTGSIRVQGCELFGGHAVARNSPSGRDAVYLAHSADIAFAACKMLAGNGYSDADCAAQEGMGGTGVNCPGRRVALYDCDARGGRGGTGNTRIGAWAGGAGVRVTRAEAFLFASGCHFEGGEGGPTTGCALGSPAGGDGGHGLEMTNPNTVHLLESEMVGGSPSEGSRGGEIVVGEPGAPIIGGPPLEHFVTSVHLSAPAAAIHGSSVPLTFRGQPGDHVFLNESLTTTYSVVPRFRGVVLVPFPAANVAVHKWGVIPPSGVLTRHYSLPTLPTGVNGRTHFLQAYCGGANGVTLGNSVAIAAVRSGLY